MLTIDDMIISARKCEEWRLASDLAAIIDLDHLAEHTNAVHLAEEYVRYVARSRVPELESILLRHGAAAAGYAAEIMKERWPEAEPIIASDPYGALIYARDVIRGRWQQGEAAILQDPWITCEYVRTVVRGRWEDAEVAFEQRWPELMEFYYNALRYASSKCES